MIFISQFGAERQTEMWMKMSVHKRLRNSYSRFSGKVREWRQNIFFKHKLLCSRSLLRLRELLMSLKKFMKLMTIWKVLRGERKLFSFPNSHSTSFTNIRLVIFSFLVWKNSSKNVIRIPKGFDVMMLTMYVVLLHKISVRRIDKPEEFFRMQA